MTQAVLSSAEIRSGILKRRRALSVAEIRTRSERMVKRFLSHAQAQPLLRAERAVSLYRPMHGEPSIDLLEPELRARSLHLHYPRIEDKSSGRIEMVKMDEPEWVEGPFGLEEPAPSHPVVDPGSLDWIIVPGVVFGESGERIGMGAGFYDRYLVRAPQAVRIAFAFEFQVQSALEQQDWDQHVHWIITEDRDIVLPALSLLMEEAT